MKTSTEQPFKRELKLAAESTNFSTSVTICLVIKNEILRAGAACYLRKQGYEIHEAQGSADEIAQQAHDLNFAVIICDRPREALIAIGQEVSSSSEFKSIVAIDVAPDEHLLNADVRVFLSSPFTPEVLLLGVQSALESSYFFPLKSNVKEIFSTPQQQDAKICQINGLSERELEVLRKLATGLSNKELGIELFVTEDTIKSHLHNLLRKLGVRNRTQLVAKFLQSNM